jgi:hypothetical protein
MKDLNNCRQKSKRLGKSVNGLEFMAVVERLLRIAESNRTIGNVCMIPGEIIEELKLCVKNISSNTQMKKCLGL